MTSTSNYVKCPKCEHDRNPSTAAKCEICAYRLGKGSGILPVIGLGVGALVLAGAGYAGFKTMSGNTTLSDADTADLVSAAPSDTATSDNW